MSRLRLLPVVLVVGLLALLIPLAIVWAQGGEGTVAISDSDDSNLGASLSDMADIQLTGLPALPPDKVYEGWFVSDLGDRKESTGIFQVEDGAVNMTFQLLSTDESITFNLDAQNSSGQSGTATITTQGDGVEVVLDLSAGAMETELVHIHEGTCGPGLGGVAHPLTSFSGGSGQSTTVIAGVALNSLRTGNFAINSHQAGNPGVYTACANIPTRTPSGENLFGAFDKFVVTIEPTDDPDPGPSTDVALIDAITEAAKGDVRKLVFSNADNPALAGGFHAGTPKGDAVGLRQQTWTAQLHANLSATSGSVDAVKLHACHVINIVEGTQGENFDATCGNPGDGIGVLNYASQTIADADAAAVAAPEDSTIVENRDKVVRWTQLTWDLAKAARDTALDTLTTDDLLTGQLKIQNAATNLDQAVNGSRQAYWAAQGMGTYVIAAEVDVPDGGGPGVGDSNVPTIALWTLVGGALLLVGGAFIYRRGRVRA